MDWIATLRDPVTINLKGQTSLLLSKIPQGSPHATALQNVSSRAELLELLSELLLVPSLTLATARAFRPLLLDLCARWLDDQNHAEDKFVALCLLLQPHEELFPVLLHFLVHSVPQEGPLSSTSSVEAVDANRLHALLLAYYRILQANRPLPRILFWSLSSLSKLFVTPHPDTGVRLLAVKCYALQSGMGEAEREKVEKEVLGEVCGVDCQVAYGHDINGVRQEIDGWMLPVLEAKRVTEARNNLVTEPQDSYFVDEDELVEPLKLSPRIANIHGLLLLRKPGSEPTDSSLIHTPTAVQSLRAIALHLSLRLPVLLTSSPSSGKSLLLSYLASALHPGVQSQLVVIHLADTSLDPRSLFGSYVSSPTQPGAFEWREGVLVRAMKQGKWVVFKDIDRASMEVLGIIKPLVESLGTGKWIGGRATLDVPNRGKIEADEEFALFATRSVAQARSDSFPPAVFFGCHKFHEVIIPTPSSEELRTIIDSRFPRLAGIAARGFIRMWEAVRALGLAPSARDIGVRELEKFCNRVNNLLPSSYQPMEVDIGSSNSSTMLSVVFPNPSLREEMYLEARDVYFGAATSSPSAHALAVAARIGEELGLSPERSEWVLRGRTPELDVEKDVNGQTVAVRIGRTRLLARSTQPELASIVARPFAMHRPAVMLLSRIATAVFLREPVLLTGETGTGKTSVVTHLAHMLRRPLISLNLSHQTESSDLLGGLKPVDVRAPAFQLQERFVDLFGSTFSRKKNAQFEEAVRKAVSDAKWKRAVGLWKEAVRMANERFTLKREEEVGQGRGHVGDGLDSDAPRKRRKTDSAVSEADWNAFHKSVQEFDVQHVQGKGKFAFGFVEGPLVKAVKSGDWILLDEINLASSETLECIASLLHDPHGSITLTEQGYLDPIHRHPDFRLFACMNPATDVGKKDLLPTVRSRFTEIEVPSPDSDRDTLLSIVAQYIGSYAVGDKAAIMDVAEFYTAVKRLADSRLIADGSNHRPHYSMRTLARALMFAADMTSVFGLRRALWEGCLMAFTMLLNAPGAEVVTALAHKHVLSGIRNPRSLLSKEPSLPRSRSSSEFVKLGPFYLEKGPEAEYLDDGYIMTPSVETKLIDLARIIATGRFPVLIEGPTSSGKTSSIEYLARRTGHRFVRINNHEHTDIQEYIGTYVSDPQTGKLTFKDGLLVQALRNGHWIVLDELNLAPTDVLEALNRLLDDNRELLIPETQEVVRPHPHFMLFATQNPPGVYAGRKILSRAFRNRFLEVHFEDVPQAELETILCQRCRIAPSYGQRIVSVFRELQKRRQSSRVFESKHGFATLRDLFRWAGRDAIGYQELAENGFMLLAERSRREEDRTIVKEVIESIMKVRIDEKALYDLHSQSRDVAQYLGCPIPSSSGFVWTGAMQRLYVLLSRAMRFNEPVLLVGETGSGKTSVCQIYAETVSKSMQTVNCHLNTETADLIGGLRPVRNRVIIESEILSEVTTLMGRIGVPDTVHDVHSAISIVERLLKSHSLSNDHIHSLEQVRHKLQRATALFEWHDGPLVEAMRNGQVILLDEVSLADDSVLERLNSVLEPGRTIVLAEKGGEDIQYPLIQANDGFKLLATMNPGGDYGKKELSPALRNRFTEIWVPSMTDRVDLEQIVNNLWRHESLKSFTGPLLDFVEWLGDKVGDRTVLGLRDILAWISFSNAAYHPENLDPMPPDELFRHAAHMTVLDGLASLPQLSAYSQEAVRRLKTESIDMLRQLVPLSAKEEFSHVPAYNPAIFAQFGSFAIRKGHREPAMHMFNLQAPTTLDNAMRVIRACQVAKPILLEGSPGVGKTSLIAALANVCGFNLHRINLSDQSDLIDLFGSDLPVDGGRPGEFVWKDAEFLRAMQEGSWVLLDEMNLAPQAVLEGLNAVLDHRGTVYIPELGRSFSRHPDFRVFAAQNPLHQGGGRKGLPRSFVNRFTRVYIEELSPQDLHLVCSHIFPDYPSEILRAMINYNSRVNEEAATIRSFAKEGSPWQFNLRDVIRWGMLLRGTTQLQHPSENLRTVYLQRFRTSGDRHRARLLFESAFELAIEDFRHLPRPSLSASHLQVGHAVLIRKNYTSALYPPIMLQTQLAALEAIGTCLPHDWLIILTGQRNSGKTSIVKLLASVTGNHLQEVFVNNATDITDILGTFEQTDPKIRALEIVEHAIEFLRRFLRTMHGAMHRSVDNLSALMTTMRQASSLDMLSDGLRNVRAFLNDQSDRDKDGNGGEARRICAAINDFLKDSSSTGRFVWVDGPLVRAMKSGHWLLLDGANLCSPSVLDRLNSLCEPNGVLTLNERGQVNGQMEIISPHPHFRLFMSVDPQYGELSRAMRNRGIEIALFEPPHPEDQRRLSTFHRVPSFSDASKGNNASSVVEFEAIRRGVRSRETSLANPPWPLGFIQHTDSNIATFLDEAPMLSIGCLLSQPAIDALSYFYAYITVPTYNQHFTRFIISSASHIPSVHVHQCLSLIRHLTSSRLSDLLAHEKVECSMTRNIPSDFLSSQPMHAYLNYSLHCVGDSSQDEALRHSTTIHILHLLVSLYREEETAFGQERTDKIDGPIGKLTPGYQRQKPRALHEAELLSRAINTAGHAVLNSLDVNDCIASWPRLQIALRLQEVGRYLKKVTVSSHFDYSAAQAIVQWIKDAITEISPTFADVVQSTKALEGTVSTSSGLGLMEIWSSFTMPKHLNCDLNCIDRMACGLKDGIIYDDLRRQTLEMMALQNLPVDASEKEKTALFTLFEQLQQRLIEAGADRDVLGLKEPLVDPSLLLAEVRALTAVGNRQFGDQSSMRQESLGFLQKILDLGCRHPGESMLRLTPYHHAYWAIDAGKLSPSIVSSLHRQWLEAMWRAPHPDTLKLGPSMLLRPTQLLRTISQYSWDHRPLSCLDSYEASLHWDMRLNSFQQSEVATRFHQLICVFLDSVLLIASCFSSSLDETTRQNLQRLSYAADFGSQASLQELSFQLENTKSAHFSSSFCRHLRSAFRQLSNCPTRSAAVRGLGQCWIALCRMILDLYVPDIPLDPAAMQECTTEYWRDQRDVLSMHIELHVKLEKCLTGNEENSVVRRLTMMLDEIQGHLVETSPSSRREGYQVSRVHLLWSEVLQFISHVVSSSKIDSLLTSISSGDDSALLREQVVQESIAGFCQRLDSLYPEFADISSPLQLAFLHMRLGLRFVTESLMHRSQADTEGIYRLASALVAFPSVRSATMVQAVPVLASSSGTDRFWSLLLKLAGFVMEVSSGADAVSHTRKIDEIYSQVIGLWLIDRAREEDSAKASQSLYKHRVVQHEATTDAEIEEAEFLALFPDFENIFEKNTSPHNVPQHPSLVASSQKQLLVDIHLRLLVDGERVSPDFSRLFLDLRRRFLSTMLDSHGNTLPETLDNESLQYQSALVRDRILSLSGPGRLDNARYNFYVDANVTETKKAGNVVEAMKQRLENLVMQWPDQMVLQHLKTRCEMVLGLDLHSPVAKVLSAVEQLLLQSDDWEMYSNRDNTLKLHQQALTALIVEWRRLELSYWHQLLESQCRSFCEGASEWWFRLYDATVRGPLAAVDERGRVDGYLDRLTPLLDDFISTSPLGQYEWRMQLLQSFERYVNQLALCEEDQQREVLLRIHRILSNTGRYYRQFSRPISTSLSQQREVLEKEIRDYIKLASWKDINVQALKQSAQRTHRQLYRTVRKFRDVMRQPILQLLRPTQPGPLDSKPMDLGVVLEQSSSHTLDFSLQTRTSGPDHLIHLERTFKRFDSLITSRIDSFIRSRSAHNVDDLAVNVIATAQNLASINISKNLQPLKRDKQHKALLVKKKKAWNDLLKELKRVGFTSNLKPEVLHRQQNQRWIREQPIILPSVGSQHVEKIDNYFDRLNASLPELRACVSSHHPDLTTRELQRAIGLLESAFTLALHARSSLSDGLQRFRELENMARRLHIVASSSGLVASGKELFTTAVRVRNIMSKLAKALEELLHELEVHISEGSLDAASSMMCKVQSTASLNRTLQESLSSVVASMSLTTSTVILEEEKTLIARCSDFLWDVSKALEEWSGDAPHLKYLFDSLHTWLRAEDLSCSHQTDHTQADSEDFNTDHIVDAFLLRIQALLIKCPESDNQADNEDGETDLYIYNDCHLVCDFTGALEPNGLLDKLGSILEDLRLAPQVALEREVKRFLPFLDRYTELVRNQIINQSYWTKALFKLVFVLCNVLQTVAKQGFCKPPDTEGEEELGDGAEIDDGVGMGEGTGAKDVSNEIEDESQIEGLQGDDGRDDGDDGDDGEAEKESGIEVNDGVDGEMKDVPENGSEDEGASDQDSQGDTEDQLGKLDSSDPSAVDEKLWGDEEGPQDDSAADSTAREDRSDEKGGESEVGAKERTDSQPNDKNARENNEQQAIPDVPEELEGEDEAGDEGQSGANGAPLDDHVQEANTLDLPDDMDLGLDNDKQDEIMTDDDCEMSDTEELEADGEDDTKLDDQNDDMVQDNQSGPPEGEDPSAQGPPPVEANAEDESQENGEHLDDSVAQPDLHAGDGVSQGSSSRKPQKADLQTGESKDPSEGTGAQDSVATEVSVEKGPSETPHDTSEQTVEREASSGEAEAADQGQESTSLNAGTSKKGNAPSDTSSTSPSNPLRSLGDALKEIHRRFNEIQDSIDGPDLPQEKAGNTSQSSELEYLRPDDSEHDMQALGPAGEEQAVKLSQLNIADQDQLVEDSDVPMDIDVPAGHEPLRSTPDKSSFQAEPTGESFQKDIESALTGSQIEFHGTARPPDLSEPKADVDMEEADEDPDKRLEMELRQWQAEGQPEENAQHLWQLYESLTHDLSYALCEQLRLILEPTQATRLKGDYRTGKRLNMKKIISYIASEYTKDKIWLRRTRPSQREYQVLIALDDSRSMAESHSVHLAYQTLALVAKALGRLEVGDIGIAKFGEAVEVLHGFDAGAFSDQAGIKVMSAFKFDQKATNVLALVDTSLRVLEEARDRRASSSGSKAGDLWQMEIIISDGICQDHEGLRTLLRKAEEQRVMIVFVIVDSLHSHTAAATGGAGVGAAHNSILSMNQVAYKNVDGRMELQMERYLDSFPFEYYVVLRDVEALPGVLSGTLKQFFERISEV